MSTVYTDLEQKTLIWSIFAGNGYSWTANKIKEALPKDFPDLDLKTIENYIFEFECLLYIEDDKVKLESYYDNFQERFNEIINL